MKTIMVSTNGKGFKRMMKLREGICYDETCQFCGHTTDYDDLTDICKCGRKYSDFKAFSPNGN